MQAGIWDACAVLNAIFCLRVSRSLWLAKQGYIHTLDMIDCSDSRLNVNVVLVYDGMYTHKLWPSVFCRVKARQPCVGLSASFR